MDHIFLKENPCINVAFFDLDRTLTGAISGNAIVRMAWKKGQISLSDLSYAFYLLLLFKLRLKDPQDVIDDMVGWVKGKSEAEMEELCLHAFREVLYPSVFPDAIKEINFHKDKNVKVIILSSALNYICSLMSESLGMDGYICTTLETRDGFLTGRPSGRLCYGREKLSRLTGFCTAGNTDLSGIWYYGDSISDLPVLNAVGNPVCVNPDGELKREALKRGWKILSWQY